MQGRHQSVPLVSRRSLRVLTLVWLTLLGVWYISREISFGYKSVSTTTHDPDMGDRIARREGGGKDPIEKYLSGFPKIRGADVVGVPEGLEKRGEVGGMAKTSFDWPRTGKMFVLRTVEIRIVSYGEHKGCRADDSALPTATIDLDYRVTGVDGGHHDQFHHKATDMKWADYLYAVFKDFHVMQYWNFARPGAVIDPVIVPPGLEKYGYVARCTLSMSAESFLTRHRTFQTQVQDFEDLFTPSPGPDRVNWHANDTLFVVFFGINDMGRLNREDLGRQDIPSTTRGLAKSLIESCKRLHALGARSFLILNIPPLEYSPKYKLPGEPGILSHDLIAESCSTFNQYLAEGIDEWRAEEGDKNLMLFDLESYWKLVLTYPEMFGMTECERYQMFLDGKGTNLGRMGYCYHDNQHISWSGAELIARNVHGFLLRHSWSFQASNATGSALYSYT
ncbi:hypothetical protein P7C73_g1594, partial [Tremellales sp. Uapishka_1]